MVKQDQLELFRFRKCTEEIEIEMVLVVSEERERENWI